MTTAQYTKEALTRYEARRLCRHLTSFTKRGSSGYKLLRRVIKRLQSVETASTGTHSHPVQ